MTRQPAVAERFYPGNPTVLRNEVTGLLQRFADQGKQKAFAVVSPHAGYIYSGAVAAEALSAVEIPSTVVILGLNHHGRGAPVAISRETWNMVMAEVPVNERLCDLLMEGDSPFVVDSSAHRYEHSVEVQIPFLLALRPDITIVPVVLSHISYEGCQEVAANLARAITSYGDDVLIVASSDMSHYESRQSATWKDRQALKEIEKMNPQGLYTTVHTSRISMCGVIPVTVALLAGKQLGATAAKVVRYTDSGAVSGDKNQVVGYAGIVVF